MMKPNDGGPAFPCRKEDLPYGCEGMSLRAWLAGQALAGMADSDGGIRDIAHDAVRIADATIAELNAEPGIRTNEAKP